MNLANLVRQKLADWHPTDSTRQSLVFSDLPDGWSIRLSADRQDALSCLLWEIEAYRSKRPSDLSLSDRCKSLVQKWKGVAEVLCVVEIDEASNKAQLRSKEPTERQGRNAYFEMVVDGDTRLTLKRYHAAGLDSRREQVAFPLTHEAIADLLPALLV